MGREESSMRHIGLFDGIGGFSLAARWMQWKTIAVCEINPFCQAVLKHHFPKAQQHGDIKTTDFTIYRGQCDIVTGGFPCQPYSQAGKRKGKEDERHLFPEMLRALREIQPRWVVGENVSGLINWERGMVLHEIKTDLENEGFEVFPPLIIPACAKDAPHRRDRLWIVAYSHINADRHFRKQDREKNGIQEFNRQAVCTRELVGANTGVTTNAENNRCECRQNDNKRNAGELHTCEQGGNKTDGSQSCGHSGDATHSKKQRLAQWDAEPAQFRTHTTTERHDSISCWSNFPTQSPLCSRNDGFPSRLAGITFSKHRNESLKAYGNAIVPQIAYEIFKAIQAV